MGFLELPTEIKCIIFKFNRLDYSIKSKKEIFNFSNRLKYKNVIDELYSCFREYCYNYNNSIIDDIIKNPINISDLVEGKIYYSSNTWIKLDNFDFIINSGIINKLMRRLYNDMYIDVQSRIKSMEKNIVK